MMILGLNLTGVAHGKAKDVNHQSEIVLTIYR